MGLPQTLNYFSAGIINLISLEALFPVIKRVSRILDIPIPKDIDLK